MNLLFQLLSTPNTSHQKHLKLLGLMLSVFFASLLLVYVSVAFGYPVGVNVFLFMLAEVSSVFLVLLFFEMLTVVHGYAIVVRVSHVR